MFPKEVPGFDTFNEGNNSNRKVIENVYYSYLDFTQC